jgi:hypothetical protein
MATKYKYLGKGNYLEGLPARDLTAEELDAYQKALLDTAVGLGLYMLDKPNHKASPEAKTEKPQ